MSNNYTETKTEADQVSILLAVAQINELRRKAEAGKDDLLARALWVATHAMMAIGASKAHDRKEMKQYAINEARRLREARRKSLFAQ